jgi:hypothetical protein
MKKILATPSTPTQKRQRKDESSRAITGVSSKATARKEDRDLKFMEATFRTVGYQSRDDDLENVDSEVSVFRANRRKSLPKGKVNLVSFIESNYQVPADFETNTRFGPHSGLCYEDRLISCYEWKQIPCQDKFKKAHDSSKAWKMCWKCEKKADHLAREGCPEEEV